MSFIHELVLLTSTVHINTKGNNCLSHSIQECTSYLSCTINQIYSNIYILQSFEDSFERSIFYINVLYNYYRVLSNTKQTCFQIHKVMSSFFIEVTFIPFLGKNIPIIFFIYTRQKKDNVENSTWLNVSKQVQDPREL